MNWLSLHYSDNACAFVCPYITGSTVLLQKSLKLQLLLHLLHSIKHVFIISAYFVYLHDILLADVFNLTDANIGEYTKIIVIPIIVIHIHQVCYMR